MTLAEWCLLGAVILYLVTLAPVKALAPREFDNKNPRAPNFYLHPVRSRARGAHINGIETFPFFAAAILLAEFRHAPQPWIDIFAVLFLATRIAFVLAYVGDRPTMRTVLWNVGMALNVGLFLLSGMGLRVAIVTSTIGIVWALVLWPIMARQAGKTF